MDSYTNNNGNLNTGNNKLYKSRSNASFGQAAVTKSDVGEFQSGYFVMVDTPTPHQQRPKTHKTPERHSRKSEQQQSHQRQRERSTNKDIDQQYQQQQREGDNYSSQGRITTSPHRSPTRNKRSPIPQVHSSEPSVPTSPHKPRKAHTDSGSPPKDKPSPTANRWAGPAFSNAPPPSSLPLPNFPPFAPSQASSSSISPSSSPPHSGPAMFAPPTMYHENIYIQPPLYTQQQYQPPQFSYQFVYADIPSQPTLAQLSTDLRKMLHIGAPIPA